jgi:prephenate dehydratase
VSIKINTGQSLAFLGPEGTFSHQAARLFLKSSAPGAFLLQACPSIPHILYAVEKGEVAYGLVPVENSIEGSVNVTMDVLAGEQSIHIHEEIVLDIKHHLFSRMQSLEQIHTVMSHPQAIAQCRRFLEQKLGHAAIIAMESTAEAVRQLANCSEGYAAIGSQDNLEFYNVPILSSDIGDYQHNQTRFLLVSKLAGSAKLTHKTSLILTLEKDRPGGLYDILGEFAGQNINLSRIESRPAKKELGSYLFFLDCEAGHNHPGLQLVIKNLIAKKTLLKNLGSYPVFHNAG